MQNPGVINHAEFEANVISLSCHFLWTDLELICTGLCLNWSACRKPFMIVVAQPLITLCAFPLLRGLRGAYNSLAWNKPKDAVGVYAEYIALREERHFSQPNSIQSHATCCIVRRTELR